MVHDDMRMVLAFWWSGLAVLMLSGCLGGAVRAVLAPQDVARQTVSEVMSANARAVDQALASGAQTSATVGQSDADLQRIIADHPDAANMEELQRLEGDLRIRPNVGQARRVGQPPPPSEFERRRTAGGAPIQTMTMTSGQLQMNTLGKRSHTLAVEPPLSGVSRGIGEPWAAHPISTMPPARYRSYVVDVYRPAAMGPTSRH